MVFKVVADDLAGVKVVTGGAGDEDEVPGDDGLREGLAHTGGLGSVEAVRVGHIIKYLFFVCTAVNRSRFVYFRADQRNHKYNKIA